MSQRHRTITTLAFGCALLAGCGGGGGGRGQATGGIHAKLAYSEAGGLRVAMAPPGGAADLAGIRVNDVIIAINGTPVRELDYQTIVERLRGPVGSTVQLDIFRKGEVSIVVVMRQAYSK